MINLNNLIKSGINIIQIVSYENERIEGDVHKSASELNRNWFKWNISSGLKKFNGKNFDIIDNTEDNRAILDWYESNEAKDSILILEEFNLQLRDNSFLISKIKDIALNDSFKKDRTLIMLQTKKEIPSELEKEVYIEELDLPSRKDLTIIFNKVCKNYGVKSEGNIEKIIESALGLTIMEAERAFSKAIVQTGQLTEKEIVLDLNKPKIEVYRHLRALFPWAFPWVKVVRRYVKVDKYELLDLPEELEDKRNYEIVENNKNFLVLKGSDFLMKIYK